MNVELHLSTGVLRAAALFVSGRRGGADTNPNAAVHFRYAGDFGVRMAATNGRDILLALLMPNTARMMNFYWPEEDQPPHGSGMLSMLITPQLLALLQKAGNEVTLSAGYSHVTVQSAGANGVEDHKVPRLGGRQISLFDDIEHLPVDSRKKKHRAGELCVDPSVLWQMRKAAKLMGAPHDRMNIALLEGGKVFGIDFGSDRDLWFFTRPLVVKPPAGSGLPPEWATVGDGDGDGLDVIAEAVGHLEAESEEEEDEQGSLPMEDEGAGEEAIVITGPRPLEWMDGWYTIGEGEDEREFPMIEADSGVWCGEDGPFYHRIKACPDKLYHLASDAELLSVGEPRTFADLEEAKLFCQVSENEMVAALTIEAAAPDDLDMPEIGEDLPEVEEPPTPQAEPDGEGVLIYQAGEEPLHVALEDFASHPHLPTFLAGVSDANLQEFMGLAARAELVFLQEQITLEQRRREAVAGES